MEKMITPEIMVKVWKLHENRIDNVLIGETLGISTTSAQRIVKLMKAAKNGEDLDLIEPNNHAKQKEFAKQFFGVEEKKEEAPKEEAPQEVPTEEQKPTLDSADFRDFAVRVLFALEYQNRLLAKLLDELGIEEKGGKK